MIKLSIFDSFDSITITAKQLIVLRPFQNFAQNKAIVSQHRTILFSLFRTISSNMVNFKSSGIRKSTLSTLRTQIVKNFFPKFYSFQKTSFRKNPKLFFLIHRMRLPKVLHVVAYSISTFLPTANWRTSCSTRRPFFALSAFKFFLTNLTNSFQVKSATLKKSSNSFISIAVEHLNRSIINTTSITIDAMEKNF